MHASPYQGHTSSYILLLHAVPVLVRRDHRQYVILGDDLIVLVGNLCIPAYLAVAAVATQCFLFAR